MAYKSAWLLPVLATIAAIVAAAGWYRTGAELRQRRIGELQPIAALLKEDQQLLQALQTDTALEKDSGILESYLAKIRADGVAKHADMKQRLDQLAENNSAIVALVNVYSPRAKTAAFGVEAEKFKHYSIAWRDRWNSVMELLMVRQLSGGGSAVPEGIFRRGAE
jgi:hypothetical protein